MVLVLFIFSLIAIIAGIVHFLINPKDSNFIAKAMKATELKSSMEEREFAILNKSKDLKSIKEFKERNIDGTSILKEKDLNKLYFNDQFGLNG